MKLSRPAAAHGATYKIRAQHLGNDGASVYVTINDAWVCSHCGKVFDEEPTRKDHPDGIPQREIFDLANPGDCGDPEPTTCHIELRPLEIFLNSKHADATELLMTLATLTSAILRQPGPFPTWLIDELKSLMSAHGGYFAAVPGEGKSRMMQGTVNHIALVLQRHCKQLGVIPEDY